jgi:adenine-specific DNA methylase
MIDLSISSWCSLTSMKNFFKELISSFLAKIKFFSYSINCFLSVILA